MKFIKLFSALLLSIVLSSALVPKKAEAGLILGMTGAGLEFESAGAIVGLTGVAMIATAIVTVCLTFPGDTPGFVPVLLVLDAEGSLAQNRLAASLAEKYPFINNQKVLENLASNINEKFKAENKNGIKEIYISLDPSETINLLNPADLTDNQVSQVVKDLM